MNKKLILFFAAIIVTHISFGKFVKFSVDMTGTVLDTNGIHITGDFQFAAGYPADWDPATTEMFADSGSMIYSVVVNIPAFHKYEFKFLNGDATYALEFVPIESRVDEIFDDNRWIYIDSLGNDTMNLAPVFFSSNHPAGKNLLRFKIDLQNENISANGVHVTGNFQSFNDATTQLYSFDGNVFQYITYIDTIVNAAVWKFVNGNLMSEEEVVPAGCANGNNMRYMNVNKDTMLPVICFASCSACWAAGVATDFSTSEIAVYPNPATDEITVTNDELQIIMVSIHDIFGREILSEFVSTQHPIFNLEHIPSGIYFLQFLKKDSTMEMKKLIIE